MVNWCIYYGSGETYSNEDGPPELAPTGNVMAVAWYDDDNRRRLAHGADYYIFDNGRWVGCDAAGFWQYMGEPGFKVVKFGRMIGELQFRKVMERASTELPIERG